MLSADTVSVVRGSRRILDRVSAAVRPGELLAILGPNGAGKSTLLHCLAGSLEADEGAVRLDGRALSSWPARELSRRPKREDHTLYSSHTVWSSRETFEGWTKSEAFRKAHQNAGQHRDLYLGGPNFEGFDVVQTVK